MLDLTFHAIEYAAYQPYMFNNQPDVYANRVESEAKTVRYQSLPPASPRVSLIQPFASGVARLADRFLTAIQRIGAHIFPRASSSDIPVQPRRAIPGPMRLDNPAKSVSNKEYRQACEDSLRTLEGVFRSTEAKEIFEQLAHFCEYRRRIANLDPAVEGLSDASTVAYCSNLKGLIGEPELKRLSACKKSLELGAGKRNLSNEQQLKLHYMSTVVGNLIEFANSKSATLISMKSGYRIT
jgi:hypothetical protein